jgi:hypothetical protein
MGQIDPSKESFGSIATLDLRRRFKIPKPILEELGWLGSDPPTELVAEIVDDGHLRIWSARQIGPALESIERELIGISNENSAFSIEQGNASLRAFHDRYRAVSLRPSDARVQLPVTLHAIVEPELKAALLYVELGSNCVEVFSHNARITRLRRHSMDINL